MKLNRSAAQHGFSLGEALVCVAITSLLFAGIFTATVGLNRAYAAADNYFSTHVQQIRIMDYLARDVKRSYSVTTSPDLKTVTCVIPDYIIDGTEPDGASGTMIGYRRTPVITGSINKAVVDYGHRSFTDGVATASSTTFSSATAAFAAADVGKTISGTNILQGTTIASRSSSSVITLSQPATGSGTGLSFSIIGDGNRTVIDAATTNGSTTLTSASAKFTSADVGKAVVGSTLVAGTKISAVTNGTTVTLSAAATGTAANMYTSFGGTIVVYSVSGSQITRTENGALTTIASSTDSLLPQTTDWQLSNTEYTTTTVTFQPIMTMNGSAAQRSGTTVYATAYLRNKRRGN